MPSRLPRLLHAPAPSASRKASRQTASASPAARKRAGRREVAKNSGSRGAPRVFEATISPGGPPQGGRRDPEVACITNGSPGPAVSSWVMDFGLIGLAQCQAACAQATPERASSGRARVDGRAGTSPGGGGISRLARDRPEKLQGRVVFRVELHGPKKRRVAGPTPAGRGNARVSAKGAGKGGHDGLLPRCGRLCRGRPAVPAVMAGPGNRS